MNEIRYVHTNIVARDWRRLMRFYCDALDCQPLPPQRDLHGPWLDRGTGVEDAALEGIHLKLPGYGSNGPTLEIYQYARAIDNDVPEANRIGLRHLAFHVEDVAATRDRIIAAGGRAVGQVAETEVEGVGAIRFIYMADPEGNLIELQHWS